MTLQNDYKMTRQDDKTKWLEKMIAAKITRQIESRKNYETK